MKTFVMIFTLLVSMVSRAQVECLTNTGSRLMVDEEAKLVTLESKDGQTVEMQITKVDVIVIETSPSIWSTNYKLNDGRALVIEFPEASKSGKGNWIRIDGTYSPEFQGCSKN